MGLLGGSFNPPHEGHLHIASIALRALSLDCVWWLVSPGNPLKTSTGPSLQTRMRLCEELIGPHPGMLISGLEGILRTARTYDTLCRLLPRFPGTDFVFLTGFDNVLNFHLWHRWRGILGLVATAHIVRPPAGNLVRSCPLRMQDRHKNIYVSDTYKGPLRPGTSFWVMRQKMNDQSSTHIRQKGSK